MADLCREDMAEVIEDAFRMNRLVVCAASYDGDVFPPMHTFLWKLKMKAFQGRKVGIVENGTWAPSAGKAMKELSAISVADEKLALLKALAAKLENRNI